MNVSVSFTSPYWNHVQQIRTTFLKASFHFGIESIINSIHTNIVPKEYVRSQYIQEFLKRFSPDTGLTPFGIWPTWLQSLQHLLYLLISAPRTWWKYYETTPQANLLGKYSFNFNENNGIHQLNVVKTHNINRSLIDVPLYLITIGCLTHKDRLLNPVVNGYH